MLTKAAPIEGHHRFNDPFINIPDDRAVLRPFNVELQKLAVTDDSHARFLRI
jgi:hypothetical protein